MPVKLFEMVRAKAEIVKNKFPGPSYFARLAQAQARI
jgi:hypothetical protein